MPLTISLAALRRRPPAAQQNEPPPDGSLVPPYEAPVLAEPFPQRQESLDVTDMPGTKPLPEYVRHHVPIEHLGPLPPPSAMFRLC